MRTTVREWPARRIKASFVVLCCGPVLWLLGPFLFEAGESLGDRFTFVGLVLAPSLIYAAVIYRKVPVIVFGTALAALELWSLWATFNGESSTSALAILAIPFFGIPLVLLGWVVQAWSRPPDF